MDRKTHKTKPENVKSGDLMAIMYYVKVKDKARDNQSMRVTDLDGNPGGDITVTGKDLIASSFSADSFQEEVKVGKLEAAELLISSHNRPLTVCFDKSDGTERILRGRLVSHEGLLGRSMVEDLDITDKNRLRQVDHRTLKWLVVEGVKYVVK